jgi:protein AbiQ
MEPKLCFIREIYFRENSNFIKILDSGNTNKQSKRTHLCVMIEYNENHFYIPLRNNLGADVRKFGRIGHQVPSDKRKNAGLDYRYALIVNDDKYIEIQKDKKIPRVQYKLIEKEYDKIVEEFTVYVNGYIKAAKKNRHTKEPLYRESSLINFVDKLL